MVGKPGGLGFAQAAQEVHGRLRLGQGLVPLAQFGVLNAQRPEQVGLLLLIADLTRQGQRLLIEEQGSGRLALPRGGVPQALQGTLFRQGIASGTGVGQLLFHQFYCTSGLASHQRGPA